MAVQTVSVNTLQSDPSRCVGCGQCAIVCPHGVFALANRLAHIVRGDACMECGACQLNCPADAITVDSGVGCAAAFIRGILTGSEPSCDTGCCDGDGAGRACC